MLNRFIDIGHARQLNNESLCTRTFRNRTSTLYLYVWFRDAKRIYATLNDFTKHTHEFRNLCGTDTRYVCYIGELASSREIKPNTASCKPSGATIM